MTAADHSADSTVKKVRQHVVRETILHVGRQLNFGGVESRMTIIAEHASGSRYHHCFLGIAHGGAAEEGIKATGSPVEILNAQSTPSAFHTTMRLAKFIRNTAPSLVHSRGIEANFHTTIACCLAGRIPCVAEEVGIPQHSAKARAVCAVLYRASNGLIAISEAVKKAMIEIDHAPARKIRVIHNPIRQPDPVRLRPSTGPFIIGFVGRLEPVKNPISLVDAVRILRSGGMDARLKIVGDGSLMQQLRDQIAKDGLAGFVDILGYRELPFDCLADCNLYVQPSITEGFGLALGEAMALGFPVLVTPFGGAKEVVQDGKTGWLLADVEPDTIAAKIRELRQLGPDALARVGMRAKPDIAERFNAARYITNCDDYYASILAKKHSC